ncbi:bifunctional 2-polyprenyl-6-hydroxyphenol methylase/3-demethylubiquinol 3-O-methyltransferase UbiG [Ferruginibacter sp.]|uniref:class I SAM-dependent methyltransferase n=1 Tax=Ferruginibacter sp. TaxID=1940288 RepID=UPI00265AF949|nr:class I SAM-dependent methyltransferase [Ferruginibacter sp.]
MDGNDFLFKNEVEAGIRFKFGENWIEFLKILNDTRIKESETTLCQMLDVSSLKDKYFLDIGSGSGLHSLAARNLGANVLSFDYDTDSVNCTIYLKNKYYPNDDASWIVKQASVLEKKFMDTLPQFDYVYSWGVLHHTGNMYTSISYSMEKVKPNGFFYIALYRKTIFDNFWKWFKKYYTRSGKRTQHFFQNIWAIKIRLAFFVKRKDFNKMIKEYHTERGMNFFNDIHDWLGGYPYEAITPAECRLFFEKNNFKLIKQNIVKEGVSKSFSSGCDEYLFQKIT